MTEYMYKTFNASTEIVSQLNPPIFFSLINFKLKEVYKILEIQDVFYFKYWDFIQVSRRIILFRLYLKEWLIYGSLKFYGR